MNFEFEHIVPNWPSFKSNNVFIWIWNADKIPPHIGVSLDKHYFSLTYKGLEEKAVNSQVQKAKRIKCPLVFVELRAEVSLESIKTCFNQFDFAKPGGATCLTPIIRLLEKETRAQQLFQLLETLHNDQQIEAYFGVHLPEGYSKLPEYTYAEIVKRIDELHAASR